MEMFKGMFGKIDPGMCRLSMNGDIAVKTGSGFKTYDVRKKRLTNCDQFVFNIGDELFFLIPTNRVAKGDIILVSGKPRCVIEAGRDVITVINYEDATIEKILPERHVFMGNTYFYGKIVSMFGKNLMKGGKGPGKMLKFMMLKEMMKGDKKGSDGNGFNGMLPFLLMGRSDDLFEDMFDFGEMDEDENEEEEDREPASNIPEE